MANFCAECGSNLNENFKFCPECGAKIISSNQNDTIGREQTTVSDPTYKKTVEIIIFENCGNENHSDNKVCDGCGIKLEGTVIRKAVEVKKPVTERVETPQPQKYAEPQKVKKKKKTKPTKKVEAQKEEKEFDTKKIYLIIAVISIFTLIILFSSDVFDVGVPTVNTNASGIDLGSLQKINNLEAKLNANPDDTETLLELAHLKNDSGFYDKAIPLYQRYLEKFPEDADARIDMGVCMYNLGDFDNAIKEMKKALEYEPNHQIGHLNLGVVNLTAGNIDVAKEWFQKAVDL
ncbi:MAG: tetratricopeptide repeat protein [Bacteroidetes bacterium]|nr:tetratricopeptide repeat protein [Bacteroidota bacterium]